MATVYHTYWNGDDTVTAVNGSAGDTDVLNLRIDSAATTAADLAFNMSQTTFTSVEKIWFNPHFSAPAGSDMWISLAAHEIASGKLSPALLVDGYDVAGWTEGISILLDPGGGMPAVTSVDLSGWTFVDWGGQNEWIVIKGSMGADTITGSSQYDEIFGNY
ncbi:MAG TPA: hypothetical protein ENK15_06800, partial [Thermopetrobacter sp.]|nr:hypothetical protein [Thermopetrobacter sp.]